MDETLSVNEDALYKNIIFDNLKKDNLIKKYNLSNIYCYVINTGVQVSAQEIIIIVKIIRIIIIIWLSFIHKDKYNNVFSEHLNFAK